MYSGQIACIYNHERFLFMQTLWIRTIVIKHVFVCVYTLQFYSVWFYQSFHCEYGIQLNAIWWSFMREKSTKSSLYSNEYPDISFMCKRNAKALQSNFWRKAFGKFISKQHQRDQYSIELYKKTQFMHFV